MQLIRGIHNIRQEHQGVVLTIGNFDGVHLGHQRILAKLKQQAEQLQAPVGVLLFEPQPREKILSDNSPARLCTLREKLQILDVLGVDFVLCQPFTDKFKMLTAESFIQDVLLKKLAIKHLMIGDDFRFGCDRKGNYALLHTYSEHYGFTLSQSQTISKNNERISSTRVRAAIADAGFPEVHALLGRPYQLTGRIIKGKQLGRTLGIPTANLHLKRHALPVNGVYAVRIHGLDKPYLAVANAGVKPTINGVTPSLEAHLLNFEDNLYGKLLTLEFLSKIRNEQKFPSLDALKAAILHDISVARDRHSSTS